MVCRKKRFSLQYIHAGTILQSAEEIYIAAN